MKLNEDEVKIRFVGDTLTFKAGFNAWQVPGRYESTEGNILAEDASQDAYLPFARPRVSNAV